MRTSRHNRGPTIITYKRYEGSPISKVQLRNFGLLSNVELQNPSGINLVIGENGTGKTFLLKALYSAVRTMEDYRRGDDIRSAGEILSEKLRWTFQVDKLGDLVTCGSSDKLSFSMELGGLRLSYSFSQKAAAKVGAVVAPHIGRWANSVFIPAKEVLSLYSVILKSREVDRSFGFDDTYYDLVKALAIAPQKGTGDTVVSDTRKNFQKIIGGTVYFDEKSGKWFYRDSSKYRFSISAASEGIKKLSIFDRLFANGYLNNQSIIFIDEVESALHPEAIVRFLDMVEEIADKMGVQFFIATHSYFVIKKLALIAMRKPGLVTCISLHKGGGMDVHDLHDGMPDNSIIETSIRLYDQEIEEGLSW